MAAHKFSGISKTLSIALYEPVIGIIDKKLAEFVRYAERYGHEIPQKKDLYNYIIGHHKDIDVKDFFSWPAHKRPRFFYTSTIISRISKSVLEKQLEVLWEHADNNGFWRPGFKNLYNYLFAQLEHVSAKEFFNIKK